MKQTHNFTKALKGWEAESSCSAKCAQLKHPPELALAIAIDGLHYNRGSFSHRPDQNPRQQTQGDTVGLDHIRVLAPGLHMCGTPQ
eukprot:1437556-Amphidinium_carterae.1